MELERLLTPNPPTIKFVPPVLHNLAIEVARKHGLTVRHLRLKRNFAPLIAAKNEFCYRAALETSKSYSAIGRFLRCHYTSVPYRIGRYCKRYGLPFPVRIDLAFKRTSIMAKAYTSQRVYPRTYGKSEPWQRKAIERALQDAALDERIKAIS